jgi:predicted transcriptional regulator of viral defense system
MRKNIYLTPQEQAVLNAALSTGRATAAGGRLHELCPELSKQAVNRACSSLSRNGYLHRLRRGLYLIQPEPSATPLLGDPYRIALELYPGYIAFSSALKLHGLLEYEPTTVFVATSKTSRETMAGQFTFKAVAMGRRAAGQMLLGRLWVSSLAKTFFDCFYRPGYAGGYSTLSKALFSAELDWREFLSYFERFASDSLCQRTAYVIDLVREAGKKVPKHVLDYFSRRVRTRTRLVPTAAGAGKWVARWQVMDNLGRDAILEWCHG